MGIKENRKKGLQGEKDYYAIESALSSSVKRTGRGSDWEVSNVDPITGKTIKEKIDNKTGKHADLSKLQKKKGAKVVRMRDLSDDDFSF